jgi:putative ABC transport system ATP-binding protein
MTQSNPIISLENVNKVYRTGEIETHALSKISFDINQGEFLSISGPSGCGKSTLLSILGLLDVPSTGQYLINAKSTDNLSLDQRAKLRCESIGFVFQAFNLIGDLTVLENVELPLQYQKGLNKQQRKAKASLALEKVGMSHRDRHFPSQLSGGQQQRVAVARALVNDPTLLLADEPTGNLDSKNGEAVIQLLRDLNEQGTTICMVTHDNRYADIANRVVQLFDGKLVDEQLAVHPMAQSVAV